MNLRLLTSFLAVARERSFSRGHVLGPGKRCVAAGLVNELVLIVSRTHPWARRRVVGRRALVSEKLLIRESGLASAPGDGTSAPACGDHGDAHDGARSHRGDRAIRDGRARCCVRVDLRRRWRSSSAATRRRAGQRVTDTSPLPCESMASNASYRRARAFLPLLKRSAVRPTLR